MKFLCDRCKTRYSIGDERVRGKILKIRCKHCSNVITVREGMQIDDASVVGPLPSAPRTKTSTIAPEALDERSASSGLLNVASIASIASVASVDLIRPAPSVAVARRSVVAADTALSNAFASATAPAAPKPPAELAEEWYVSIDGEQSGPYSLAEAQRWVAARPLEADLHCWSEGFDDWLPVDKVSHFRGLRKRPVPPPAPPAATAMPALPRTISPRPSAASTAPATTPLRPVRAAATVPAVPVVEPVPVVPTPASELPPQAHATPAFGTAVPPRTNGAAPLPRATPDDQYDEAPEKTQLLTSSPHADMLLAAGRLQPPLTADAPAEAPTPLFLPASSFPSPSSPAAPALSSPSAPAPAPGAATHDGFAGDDDLDIGEVSRVVNLADLARQAKPRRTATSANPRNTGAQPTLRATGAQASLRSTGAQAAFRGTGAQPSLSSGQPGPGPVAAPALDAVAAPLAVDTPIPGMAGAGIGPSIATPDGVPPVATSHRRGLFALLGVAGVLVIGVVIAVFVLVSPGDTTGGSLGKVNDIDTSRPDDPIAHRPTGPTPTVGSGSATASTGQTLPRVPHRPNPPPVPHDEPPTPSADSLRSDEIEDTARKHQDTTQRCYMRSQRGADAILVGDVKKIAVTLQIEKDGTVTDVQLSDHAADTLGKCLSTSIRGWKFRTSAGGRFRFSLNFVSG